LFHRVRANPLIFCPYRPGASVHAPRIKL
jgi:hypothetical protein